jgi:hypothetical protein
VRAAAYTQAFPSPDNLTAMRGANRFAIGADVAGTWSSSTSAGIDMYYTATGGYAGMNAASIADTFWFAAKGGYKSEHKGATGMVGRQQVFQAKYKGSWRRTGPWELVVKRSDGTTTVYDAHYEAVRGGQVLHLQDKRYSGSKYALVRTGK